MKILVVVSSKHGSTREIAYAITEELRHSGITAELRAVNEVADLAGYDAVVLGSGIYAGSWLSEARAFAEQRRAELSKLPVWLFSSGPLGADNPKPQDDPDKLASPLGDVSVREHRVFAGKLDPAILGFGERLVTRMVQAPYGDFRDWEAIRAWAREIATCLAGAPISA